MTTVKLNNNPPKKLRIVVELMLTSPMHITALGSGRYVPDTGRIMQDGGGSDAGIPCTLTRKLPVVRQERNYTNKDGVSKTLSPTQEVPVIPASTLCGKLRNAASMLIENSFIARQQHIKPATFVTMRSGTATATMQRDLQGIAMSRAGANDPFFGLFGGTTFCLDANLVVHEGYAYTNDTQALLSWTPQTLTLMPSFDTLAAMPIVRKNQLFEWQGADHMIKLMGEQEVMDYIGDTNDKLAASKAKKAAGESGKKVDLRSIAAAEVVVPGVGFVCVFDVTYRNQAQLGLFLLALREVVNSGQVGGRKAKGAGMFKTNLCKMLLSDDDGAVIRAVDVFKPRVEGQPVALSESAEISQAKMAVDEFLETVNASHYEKFAASDAHLQFKDAA